MRYGVRLVPYSGKEKAAKFSPKGHPLPRAAERWVRGSLLLLVSERLGVKNQAVSASDTAR